MAAELETVVGFHKVNNVKARELLQPHIHTDGFYLLRPSSDSKGGVLCTICVTNKSKLMNYRLVQDRSSGHFYIHSHTSFPAISLLLGHYKATPINAEANTRLLYPVGPPRGESPSQEGESTYVIMERQSPLSPDNTNSNDTDIPGLHTFLPKSEISSVMSPYIGTNGYYLLRPSASSEGQLTLAVSHSGKVLNFKINCDKKKYFISPKKRFSSIKALLHNYQSNPIRSKKCGDEKIFLLYPVPVDLEREKEYQEMKMQKVAAQEQLSTELPAGWTEHWHNTYNKPYFYNAETGQSLWERPKPPPPTVKSPPPLPGKSPNHNRPRMKDRPLPSVPPSNKASTNGPSNHGNSERRFSRPQQPLPSVPNQQQNGYNSQTLPSRRLSKTSERDLPPLPPKDDSSLSLGRRDLPPLPPKEDTTPPGVTQRGGTSAPGISNRPPIPIPGRGQSPNDSVQRSRPPLPQKENTPTRRASTKPLPKPPPKTTPSKQNGLPPLPAKEDNKPLPPLPPKSDHDVTQSLPPHLQTTQNKPKRKRVVEYEDTVPLHQAEQKQKQTLKPLAPPPLPEKEPPQGAMSNGPPPPPPPPAIGAPPPPPPPPSVPPPPSPNVGIKPRGTSLSVSIPSTQSDSSGRPFTAGDLTSQRNMLKKRENVEEPIGAKRSATLSGIAGVFANAIDTRRKAMVDSESEESDFEDVEEDDDWD